jgi:hypothetical protein
MVQAFLQGQLFGVSVGDVDLPGFTARSNAPFNAIPKPAFAIY